MKLIAITVSLTTLLVTPLAFGINMDKSSYVPYLYPFDKNPYKKNDYRNSTFKFGFTSAVLSPCKNSPNLKGISEYHYETEVPNMHTYIKTTYNPNYYKQKIDSFMNAYKYGEFVGKNNPIDCKSVTPLKQQPLSKSFHGVWEGQAKQGRGTFSVKVTLSNDKQLLDLPSVGCGGVLNTLKSYSNHAEYKSTFTYGKNKCTSSGSLSIEFKSPNTAIYKWFAQDGSASSIANLSKRN